ncbi:SHOCT domain-containing protein [Bacillus kwashiorkori]|uniref:SHOCT domain-containing protein n=1 Tax=Bacillus kwashiorkori TaxID=1522318 RepID=UPI00078604A1|nr:SHOCT domain-containing protein [Bacillus kwashiorkori]
MMGLGHGFGIFGMGGGSIMMILIVLLIGYLFYLGMNNQKIAIQNKNQQVTSSNALEIAKSRLAQGEISFEEFEQIKKNIL